MKVTLDTTSIDACAFSGCKRQPTYRHHAGCDNFIGQFNALVRVRYPLFLDCVSVCDYHHLRVHFNYGRLIKAHDDWTPAGALRLRAKLIAKCDRLINGTDKLRKPTKQFVLKWRRRRRAWLKTLKANRST